MQTDLRLLSALSLYSKTMTLKKQQKNPAVTREDRPYAGVRRPADVNGQFSLE